jgi:hypothetical protein
MNRGMSRLHLALTLAAACLVAACSGGAQTRSYFAALSLPPDSVGTCLAFSDRPGRDNSPGGLHSHRLVMVSRVPGSRRVMTALTDSSGRWNSYNEMVDQMIGRTSFDDEFLFAAPAPNGQVRGVIGHMTMPLPPAGSRDTGVLHALRERAKRAIRRDSLDPADQARVRAAAAWLIRRCPA